jgi:hypothetical protein
VRSLRPDSQTEEPEVAPTARLTGGLFCACKNRPPFGRPPTASPALPTALGSLHDSAPLMNRLRSSLTQQLPDRTTQLHSPASQNRNCLAPDSRPNSNEKRPTPNARPVANSPTFHLTSNRSANANKCSTPDAPIGAFTQPTATATNRSARAGSEVNNGVNTAAILASKAHSINGLTGLRGTARSSR